jgi:hypothetical protein
MGGGHIDDSLCELHTDPQNRFFFFYMWNWSPELTHINQ